MVEYFGEQLDGFATSASGWVQSYRFVVRSAVAAMASVAVVALAVLTVAGSSPPRATTMLAPN